MRISEILQDERYMELYRKTLFNVEIEEDKKR